MNEISQDTKKTYITDNCRYIVDDEDKIHILEMIMNSETDKKLIIDNGDDCIAFLDDLTPSLIDDIYNFLRDVMDTLSQIPI